MRIIIDLDGRCENEACIQAMMEGRFVHASPIRQGNELSLVLPTYHFHTEDEARAVITEAEATSPIVKTDEDLYRYRAEGVAYRLPTGWIDPDRR